MLRSRAMRVQPFVLVEWMLGLVIIGILATLAIPTLQSAEPTTKDMKRSALVQPAQLRSVQTGVFFAAPDGGRV
ncbi:MAG: hypothetical protein VCB25_10855, partial [Myxococcota bacterium]